MASSEELVATAEYVTQQMRCCTKYHNLDQMYINNITIGSWRIKTGNTAKISSKSSVYPAGNEGISK